MNEEIIDIKNLNKAAVLAALYNNAHVQGLGFIQAKQGDMSIEEAEKILKEGSSKDYGFKQTTYFDYLNGRVMKIDLSSDQLDTRL